jgi:hypothetical protein
MLEAKNGEGNGYPVASYRKLNRKRVPLDSTFLWKLWTNILSILASNPKQDWKRQERHDALQQREFPVVVIKG